MGVMEAGTAGAKDGLKSYYKAKIEEHELAVRDKTQNLRRLEAQRNELNTKGAFAPCVF
jgi:26S proteasome regulatory subunit T6